MIRNRRLTDYTVRVVVVNRKKPYDTDSHIIPGKSCQTKRYDYRILKGEKMTQIIFERMDHYDLSRKNCRVA